jgi:hypothetical protein
MSTKTINPQSAVSTVEDPMQRILAVSLFVLALFSLAPQSEAARVRVVRRGPHRTTVVVHRGFPLHRGLPEVVVREPRVAIRVTPRVFLPPVVFGAVVVAERPAPGARVWEDRQVLMRDEGWTEFTLNADQRGRKLLLDVSRGPAQISFAEVVFENGETQVVDFADGVHHEGLFSLLDFRDGRKVDHVRVVAKADARESQVALVLVS